jgi:transposase
MAQFSASATRLAALLQGEVIETVTLQVHLIPVVHRILEQLQFARIVEKFCGDAGDVESWKLFEAFIHSRVGSQAPVPLSHLEEWIAGTVLPHTLDAPVEKFNEYRFGRVIEAAGRAPRALWIELVREAHRVYGFDLSWDIYDITSIYLEGEYTRSDLAEYGYSRDGKPGTKQVNIGLNVTGEDGIPILYHLFPGNTEDSTTVVSNLQQMKALFNELSADGAPEILGDRAMLSAELVHRYLGEKIDFIGSMKTCKLMDDLVASIPEDALLQHPMDYMAQRHRHLPTKKQDEERYYAVRTEVTIPAHKDVPGSFSVTLPCLVVLASGKRRLDLQHRETLLSRTEQRLREISDYLNKGKYRHKKYAEDQVNKALMRYAAVKNLVSARLSGEDGSLTLSWQRDEQAIQKAATADGRYVIVFANASRSTQEVFRKFKCRDRVEKRVDDIKGAGPVVVRPIYLHKDERIRGLVLGCMISLLVTSISELMVKRKLRKKITAEATHGVFRGYSAALHTLADRSQLLVMPVGNKWQRQILNALDVSFLAIAPLTAACGETNTARGPGAVPPPWEDVSPEDVPSG